MPKFTDEEINELITEPKLLIYGWDRQINNFKLGRGSKTAKMEIQGTNNNNFKVIIRQNTFDIDHFSTILGCYPPDSTTLFILLRYDGNDHEHTNTIERTTISFQYHIHKATERYQERGSEDGYAEATNRYTNIREAFNCLLEDANFQLPEKQQLPLLGWF